VKASEQVRLTDLTEVGMFALNVFLGICCAAIIYLIGFLVAIERESLAAKKRTHGMLVPFPSQRVISAPAHAPVARMTVRVGSNAERKFSYPVYHSSEMGKRASGFSGIRKA
jgi:hypothetical protein